LPLEFFGLLPPLQKCLLNPFIPILVLDSSLTPTTNEQTCFIY
jgi:hypothetical protein